MGIIILAVLIAIPLCLIHHGKRRWGACVFGAYLVVAYLRSEDPWDVVAPLFFILMIVVLYWQIKGE